MRQYVSRALAVCAAAAVLCTLSPAPGQAADHKDSPVVKQSGNETADITDIYAFRVPNDNTRLVVVLNVNPRDPGQTRRSYFDNNTRYIMHVTACNSTNIDVVTTFTGSGSNQMFTVHGLTPADITGRVDDLNVQGGGGAVKVFCGGRDDPFFFDLDGFNEFLSEYLAGRPYTPDATSGLRKPGELPADHFAGADVSSIVLEFPISALAGCTSTTGVMKAWAETQQVRTVRTAPTLTQPIR
jgi:hypothetical protein